MDLRKGNIKTIYFKYLSAAVMLHANCKIVAFKMKNLRFKKGAFERLSKPFQNALFSILKSLL